VLVPQGAAVAAVAAEEIELVLEETILEAYKSSLSAAMWHRVYICTKYDNLSTRQSLDF
jgi:hypothetical protein